MKLILSILLTGCCTLSYAQANMYKCKVGGSVVYSDQPCGDNAQKIRKDAAPEAAPASVTEHVCAQKISTYAKFDEPDHIVIESIKKGNSAAIEYMNGKVYAKTYYLKISERTASGAYTGTRSYTCHVSEDEQRILKVTGPY
ncbi:DUF4124 domain-containing protein [Undibacterium terreum]|uniref:DUF4124 domain-containing protein n=1 Tax=Undibacterium terreum TaxID=1224302 RepID=A0A916UZQ0_9BURK|nr:DUF4124 domain-containing protein [Undibacterium terreum]GGC97266.1 hypothetical protein GCM10011396_50980 [Undibacterium terreum]